MDFTKNLKDKINVWKNDIIDIKKHDSKYAWILKNHKKIYNHIVNKYTNLNSLRSHISALTSIIKAMRGSNSYLYKQYSKIAIKIQKQIEGEQSNQTVPENRKDHYVTFEEIEQRREKIKGLFIADPTNNKLNLQYLVLCLYTYQPPIRTEYKNMRIVDKIPNKYDNFILHKNKKYFVVIQNDKVIRTHGVSIIELAHPLEDIINESLRYYPREYILSLVSNPKKQLGTQNFNKLVHDCFPNKNVGVDLIRSAYITHKYNDSRFSMKQKKELALLMRSSIHMAQNTYHKIVDVSDIDFFINKICKDPDLREKLKLRIQNVIDELMGIKDEDQ